MHVLEYWKSGRKYFELELETSEAKLCLSNARHVNVTLAAYGADLFPKPKVFYMDYLKVSSLEERNKGHGTALLLACLKWATITRNVIILDAIPIDNKIEPNRLIRFYLKNGFKLSTTLSDTAMIYHMRPPGRKR